jgi:hypothetical protein
MGVMQGVPVMEEHTEVEKLLLNVMRRWNETNSSA